jgi:plasmid stabilization system protein ParE
MSRTILWSAESKADLRQIRSYYDRRNGNSNYSKRLMRMFRDTASMLSRFPHASMATDQDGVRGIVVRDHIHFFRHDDNLIYVLFIWDIRRDPSQISDFLR